MGSSVSAHRTKAAAEVQEQLDFLVKVANFKLDKYQNELEETFTEKEYTGKRQVPGMRALRWARGYRVGVQWDDSLVTIQDANAKNPPLSQTSQAIKEIVEGLFGLDRPEEEEKIIVDTIRLNVERGLKFVIQSKTAGEIEESKFFVFMLNNAFVRVDVRIWKYNFNTTDVIAASENVLCYMLCMSIVDHSVLKLDEVVYLVSEYAPRNTRGYSDELTRLWHSVNNMAISLPDSKVEPNEQGHCIITIPQIPIVGGRGLY